jgi:hypothetical protein
MKVGILFVISVLESNGEWIAVIVNRFPLNIIPRIVVAPPPDVGFSACNDRIPSGCRFLRLSLLVATNQTLGPVWEGGEVGRELSPRTGMTPRVI